jgi:hypothetical protein
MNANLLGHMDSPEQTGRGELNHRDHINEYPTNGNLIDYHKIL